MILLCFCGATTNIGNDMVNAVCCRCGRAIIETQAPSWATTIIADVFEKEPELEQEFKSFEGPMTVREVMKRFASLDPNLPICLDHNGWLFEATNFTIEQAQFYRYNGEKEDKVVVVIKA